MTTFNPSDKHSSVALSGGNLTATLTTEPPNVAGVRSTTSKASGKWVVEVTAGELGYFTLGLCTSASSLAEMPGNNNNLGFAYNCNEPTSGEVVFHADGNDVNVGGNGDMADNTAALLAVDLDNKLAWFKVAGGAWNGSETADPDTGTGGRSFSTVSFSALYLFYGGGYDGDGATVDFAPAGHGLANFLAWDDPGGASATLTGLAAFTARGSLAARAVVGATGAAAATGQAGALADSLSRAILGAQAAATTGSTAPTLARPLAGMAGAAQAGVVTPASPSAPVLAGAAATGSAGAIDAAATAGIVGLPASAAMGSLSIPGQWSAVSGGLDAWSHKTAAAGGWISQTGAAGSWI